MPTSPNPSKTGRRRLHARDVDATIHAALKDVQHAAKVPTLHADSELIMACAVAADVWHRHNRLFHGSSAILDDTARDKVAAVLWIAVEPVLNQICDLPPITEEGHRARAAVFLAWDAGELLARAGSGRVLDRLPLAMLLDLL